MKLERIGTKNKFKDLIRHLDNKAIVLRGARQTGKTFFVNEVISELESDYIVIRCNFLYEIETELNGVKYYGRAFWGQSEQGISFLNNLETKFGKINQMTKPVLVFLDEVDHFPFCLEAIQNLAQYTPQIKFIFTGSNLENIVIKNAATGRKAYFNLYPFSFLEYLLNNQEDEVLNYIQNFDFKKDQHSDYYDEKALAEFNNYLRLGGMPVILKSFSSGKRSEIPSATIDLITSIEENIKSVLADKALFYE